MPAHRVDKPLSRISYKNFMCYLHGFAFGQISRERTKAKISGTVSGPEHACIIHVNAFIVSLFATRTISNAVEITFVSAPRNHKSASTLAIPNTYKYIQWHPSLISLAE